jgi:hypothetical protein
MVRLAKPTTDSLFQTSSIKIDSENTQHSAIPLITTGPAIAHSEVRAVPNTQNSDDKTVGRLSVVECNSEYCVSFVGYIGGLIQLSAEPLFQNQPPPQNSLEITPLKGSQEENTKMERRGLRVVVNTIVL